MMKSIVEQFNDHAKSNPDKKAIVFYHEGGVKEYTYGQLIFFIKKVSEQLDEKYDLKKGDRVLLTAPQHPFWIICYFALHVKGVSVIHLDVQSTELECQTVTDFSQPKFVMIFKDKENCFKHHKQCVFIEDLEVFVESLDQTQAESLPQPKMEEEPMSILFTSGTTDQPKGVMLTEKNFLSNLKIFQYDSQYVGENDKVIAFLPFHHIYPFTCTVLAPLYFNASIIIPRSIKGEDVFLALNEQNATVFTAVPKVLELFHNKIMNQINQKPKVVRKFFYTLMKFSKRFLKQRDGFKKIIFRSIHSKMPSLRYFSCGGARFEPQIHENLNALGFKIIEAYGLSETSPISTINSFQKPIPGSVGTPPSDYEIQINNPNPETRHGEIWIKGDHVMKGYLNRDDLTKEVITEDGWFKSGDLGYVDEKNNLHITGRIKEVIILDNGKNIYPQDIEHYFKHDELINEQCVFDVEIMNQKILAIAFYPKVSDQNVFVEVKKQILEFVEKTNQQLPSYFRVKKVFFSSEEFPKTSLGKIKRFQIKAMYSTHPQKTRKSSTLKRHPFLELVKRITQCEIEPEFHHDVETDLGFDSLTLYDIIAEVEKEFDIEVNEEQFKNIRTLQDIYDMMPPLKDVKI